MNLYLKPVCETAKRRHFGHISDILAANKNRKILKVSNFDNVDSYSNFSEYCILHRIAQ